MTNLPEPPMSRAELEAINKRNRQAYEQAAIDKAKERAATKERHHAELAARRQRMLETSCGSVEQTGNPRAGCTCERCSHRRKIKAAQKKNRRRPNGSINDNDYLDVPTDWINFRTGRFAKYGLTEAQFTAMLRAQGYKCAICGTTKPGQKGSLTSWAVDHDHDCCPAGGSCGKCVRGLLCQNCNLGLGNFKDSTDTMLAAIAYLQSRQ